ncbi:MAG: SDR family oxidoreductase, partial [Candidatus Hinthialibacter sp.]
LEEWRAMVETNIHGVFYAVRAVLPFMKDQGGGHIINISSISGRLPLPGGSGYAATKYAVTGFSESLMQEVRDYGIKVTTIFPGSVDSESHRHDADKNHLWKIKPEEVGETCYHVLNTAPGALISRVEIRPLHRPPKQA